jgi:ribulose-phosphate 3-epimerase
VKDHKTARRIRIVPSILTDDPKTLEKMVRQAEGFATYVQFDIMDGRFVPSHSITYQHLMALPTKLSWEAHLMVERPLDYLNGFTQAGAKKIIFHYEATSSPEKVISSTRRLGLEVGLAANPETRVSDFLSLADKVDSVVFLTVHPGFYGSPFMPEVLDKVTELRGIFPKIEIGVDGGVKESNIGWVARAGVDVIYVGSAIFLQSHPAQHFQRLVILAREALKEQMTHGVQGLLKPARRGR